jgi:Helix-turn-helix domain
VTAATIGASQRLTACDRLLALFEENRGQEISLVRILALGIAQYNARILELRAAGHVITNRTEWKGSAKHSWFRYEGKAAPEAKP